MFNKKMVIIILLTIIIIGIVVIGVLKIIKNNSAKQLTEQSNIANTVEEKEDIKEALFEKYYNKAEETINSMTLEEKVSQMFMARCPSSGANDIVSRYKPGGYVLFANDFKGKSKQDVIEMINGFQNRSKIPMIISVDEEGGSVCRISTNPNLAKNKFKSPQELYKEGGFDRIYNDTIEKSKLLISLGINMNLSPVADVSTNENDYIYKRTFGKDANQTSKYVETVVNAMKTENIACSLKHFPGYGNNKDSHKEVTYDNRSIEVFETTDFIPFKVGIESGAQTILVSHNIVSAIDKEKPASISKKVHELLRNELEFEGLIITDDLSMSATKNYASVEEIAIMAVEAGNDIILSSDFVKQRDAVINAVKSGRIQEEKIDEAVRRILAFKYYMKLM